MEPDAKGWANPSTTSKNQATDEREQGAGKIEMKEERKEKS